jgi:hypothetical protein
MLAKRPYIVVSPDSVRLLRPQFPTVTGLAGALASDLLVSIRIIERPRRTGTTDQDSVMLQITAYDLTAKPQYGQRTLPVAPNWSLREQVLGPLEALLLQTVGALDEMSRAPRRTASDPTQQQFIQLPTGGRFGIDTRPLPPKKPPRETTTR